LHGDEGLTPVELAPAPWSDTEEDFDRKRSGRAQTETDITPIADQNGQQRASELNDVVSWVHELSHSQGILCGGGCHPRPFSLLGDVLSRAVRIKILRRTGPSIKTRTS
jgi:hypothetical protein